MTGFVTAWARLHIDLCRVASGTCSSTASFALKS
ncbi:putative leader peptide [Rhodococcus sp. NPDC004095]